MLSIIKKLIKNPAVVVSWVPLTLRSLTLLSLIYIGSKIGETQIQFGFSAVLIFLGIQPMFGLSIGPNITRFISYVKGDGKSNKVEEENRLDLSLVGVSKQDIVFIAQYLHRYVIAIYTILGGLFLIFIYINHDFDSSNQVISLFFVISALNGYSVLNIHQRMSIFAGFNKIYESKLIEAWLTGIQFLIALLLTVISIKSENFAFVGILALLNILLTNFILSVRLKKELVKYVFLQEPKGRLFINGGIFNSIVKNSARGGFSVLISVLVINGFIIDVAESHSNDGVTFLFAMRLIQAITAYIQVPFLVNLPNLSNDYAIANYNKIAKSLELQKYFVVAVIAVIAIVTQIFWADLRNLLPGVIVELNIWKLMLCSLVVERLGAINIQTHSLSNRVDWHIANGGQAIIFVGCLALFGTESGMISVPAFYLAANFLWYYPFSAQRAYSILPEKKWSGDFAGLALVSVIGMSWIYQERLF